MCRLEPTLMGFIRILSTPDVMEGSNVIFRQPRLLGVFEGASWLAGLTFSATFVQIHQQSAFEDV